MVRNHCSTATHDLHQTTGSHRERLSLLVRTGLWQTLTEKAQPSHAADAARRVKRFAAHAGRLFYSLLIEVQKTLSRCCSMFLDQLRVIR
jgi:hypothetical protein